MSLIDTIISKALEFEGVSESPPGSNNVIFNTDYYGEEVEGVARYEDDFAEDDTLPTFIPSEKLNKFIFNANTVDTVLQDIIKKRSASPYK